MLRRYSNIFYCNNSSWCVIFLAHLLRKHSSFYSYIYMQVYIYENYILAYQYISYLIIFSYRLVYHFSLFSQNPSYLQSLTLARNHSATTSLVPRHVPPFLFFRLSLLSLLPGGISSLYSYFHFHPLVLVQQSVVALIDDTPTGSTAHGRLNTNAPYYTGCANKRSIKKEERREWGEKSEGESKREKTGGCSVGVTRSFKPRRS